MKTKTLEQIALVIALAFAAWYYFTKRGGFNLLSPASPNVGGSNGLPYFMTYNAPTGFTGASEPLFTEPLPSGTTGTTQPVQEIYSFFPSQAANQAQT